LSRHENDYRETLTIIENRETRTIIENENDHRDSIIENRSYRLRTTFGALAPCSTDSPEDETLRVL